MKEDQHRVWQQPNKAAARHLLDDWIRRAERSGIRMLKKFANTQAPYRNQILNDYDSPISHRATRRNQYQNPRPSAPSL